MFKKGKSKQVRLWGTLTSVVLLNGCAAFCNGLSTSSPQAASACVVPALASELNNPKPFTCDSVCQSETERIKRAIANARENDK